MVQEIVFHEFSQIGKYRVRLVRADLKAPVTLDVREYVKGKFGDTFEGFTRRGIKLSDIGAMKALRDSLTTAIDMLEVKK